ncbi:MAG: hypothetical protein KDA80_08435 [Planctomycetaceae bacterium]|nr:hypothetical protein [Planctomycetaceae bacterium]
MLRQKFARAAVSAATLLTCHSIVLQELLTAPITDQTAPNSSVATSAKNLFAAQTYKIFLALQLSGAGPFFDVGSTSDFSGATSHSENVNVLYNPGPGTHPGKAQLCWNNMGHYQQEDLSDFDWHGPPM